MTDQPTPDPLAYGPTGYRCGCGKDAHSNLVPCQPDRPYTDTDLRAEAARQHYTATTDPDFMGIGEQMADAAVPSTDDGDSSLTWHELLVPEGGGSYEAFGEAQRAIDGLLGKAADVSEWAINLGAEGLVPAEHRLVHSVDDGPVHAAFHIALDRRLELDTRAYDAIADVIRAHLLIREDSAPAVDQPAAESQPVDPREPFRFVDDDGDYLHIGIPATPANGGPAISFHTETEPVHLPVDRVDEVIATLRRLKAAQQ